MIGLWLCEGRETARLCDLFYVGEEGAYKYDWNNEVLIVVLAEGSSCGKGN